MDSAEFKQLLRKLGACEEARVWADGKSLAEVWAQCDRADWLLWLCGKMEGQDGWPNRKQIVGVACDCAELALPYIKVDELRPKQCIDTVRKWINGEATIDEVRVARPAAAAAADAADDAAYAASAAASAAYAADDAAYAAYAAAAREEIQAKCCVIIRDKLTPKVLA